jgi:hypothetical protein
MATNFTPDEEVEIALLLWEYERDGAMAIDNFIRSEPALSLRLASGVLPLGMQRTIIEYIKNRDVEWFASAVLRNVNRRVAACSDGASPSRHATVV